MNVGVLFPQTEFGSDPGAIREFAQTAEELGYSHILTYEHVLGANPDRPGGWNGIYDYEDSFLEPISLFSYLAAITERISLVTSILILPQRQTALVAKQVATLDVLSGGRIRLGVGIGWNAVEYLALGENFRNRGRRLEEQLELMRALWKKPLVEFQGSWHELPDVGINPRPVQQPIPIWFGGHADPVLRRAARMADGWMPTYRSAAEASPHVERLRGYLEQQDRSASDFGIEARVHYREGDPERLTAEIRDWSQLGATHVGLNTMRSRLNGPHEHLKAIRAFAETAIAA